MSEKKTAYLITMRGCDSVVATGDTPWKAVDQVIRVFNAENAAEGWEDFSHENLEQLQELGEFYGLSSVSIAKNDCEHDWGFGMVPDWRRCFNCGTEEILDEGSWGPP